MPDGERRQPRGEQRTARLNVYKSWFKREGPTFPVVRSWCSKNNIVEVLGEGGSQTLLAGAEHLVSSGSALTEVPAAAVFVRGRVDGQVLTQDVAAPCDVTGLLRRVHEQTPLVAVSARLTSHNGAVLNSHIPQHQEEGNRGGNTHHNLSSRSLALDRHPHPLILLVLHTDILF